MKRTYKFLQTHAMPICLVFGITPHLPLILPQSQNGSWVLYATWFLFLASALLFILCFWWLKAKWLLPRVANMTALTLASFLGLMISVPALMGMYGFETSTYFLWKGTPAHVVQTAMVIALLFQILGVSPFGKIPRDK